MLKYIIEESDFIFDQIEKVREEKMNLNLEFKNKKGGMPDDFYFDNNSDDSQS